MSTKYYAIVSGNLAESKKVKQELFGRIPDIIRDTFAEVKKQLGPEFILDYEIIRMDEFMCKIDHTKKSLHCLLMLASEFRRRSYTELNTRLDLSLSLAIGPVEIRKSNLRESDGTAIRNATGNLQKMKRNQRLQIHTTEKALNDEFLVGCAFMDIIIHDWSDEQAEAFFLKLAGRNQVQISEELKISQPAVNRRLKAAHLEAIETFIHRFEAVIE